MTRRWEGVGARARGLSAHLLGDERMRGLERTREVGELVRELHDTPYARFLGNRAAAPRELEAAISRSAAERLVTLGRWASAEGDALSPIFLEQDARNLRAILRGLVGAVSREQRLAGSLPTPVLDRRALEALAGAESTASLASRLVAWGHPLGSALLKGAEGARRDTFRMEAALMRGVAMAASTAAESGGEVMRRFVSDSVDARNIFTALLLVRVRREGEPVTFFVDGGRCLSRRDFVLAATAADPARCIDALAAATRGTLFVAPLLEPASSPSAVAARILSARVGDLRRRGRLDPLSPAPAILFFLRLRLEMQRLRRVLWRLSLTVGGRS